MKNVSWALFLLLLMLGDSYSKEDKHCPLYEGFRDSVCFVGDKINSYVTDSPTSWIIEFYSSWCGHCHHFSPTWKKIATKIKKWSRSIRIGQIDCTSSQNRDACDSYNIQGFPTIKLFKPHERNPHSKDVKAFVGARSMDFVMTEIIKHLSPYISSFTPITSSLSGTLQSTDVLIFEDESSIIGKQIVLDFLSQDISIRRVHQDNVELTRQYSILELPSIAILQHSTHQYKVVSSSSTDKSEQIIDTFESAITEFLPHSSNRMNSRKVVAPTDTNTNTVNTHRPSTAATRATMTDILSAVSYALRYEVTLNHIISGESFYALHQFLFSLEKAFFAINLTISNDLRQVRTKLDSRYSSGLITGTEWQITLRRKLSTNLFPATPYWIKCAGSMPHLRGFPCGLWSLMHTVTVLSMNTDYPNTSSREALYSMARFIIHFFSCADCRTHFSELFKTLQRSPLSYDGDSILWLWEAHNVVNKRLKDKSSNDPVHPKSLFPSIQLCPYCYIKINKSATVLPSWDNIVILKDGSQATVGNDTYYIWNKTAVFLFLCNFYGYNLYDPLSHIELVQIAWPRSYPETSLHDFINRPNLRGRENRSYNSLNFLVLILLILAAALAWLLYRNTTKRTLMRSKLL